jgi:hypothetical protein
MSEASRSGTLSAPGSIARRLTAGLGLSALLLTGGWTTAGVSAQEASPTALTCDAPTLPPGTPTPIESMLASPEAMPGMTEEEAAGTPEAVDTGMAADDATTAAATAAAQNVVNCINSGNVEGAVALMTPNFLNAVFYTGNPYDVIAGGYLDGTSFGDVTFDKVKTYSDGRLSIEAAYLESEYQYVHELWYLAEDGGYWKLDGLESLAPEPEGDTAVIGVALGTPDDEYALVPNVPSTLAMPVLIFHVANTGTELHELLVLKLPEGMTPDALADDSTDLSTVEFIGGLADIAPGTETDLALVNLPAGEYTLACFYTAPDGQTHLQHGMVATFTVEPQP